MEATDKNILLKSFRTWESADLAESIKRVPERPETQAFQRLHTPLDAGPQPPDEAEQQWYLEKLGFPGQYPFTRGVQPTMYRSRFWTMRQYAGYGTAAEANERFKYLLGQGQTGLSIAFDLATQIGYDSDDPLASGEVGQAGVAINSLADMEALLDGIPLDKVSISMTINAPASVLLAMVIAAGEKRGVPAAKLTGTIQNDILKEYVARGTYIFPPGPSVRLAADTIAYCARSVPRWNAISVSGYHIRDAGSTAAQEMGFALANAIAYMDAVLERGISIDDFASRISWIFNTQNNFFEEVAKYRALRRLWATILREQYGAKKPASMTLRTHIQTGGATLTAQQPLNNIARAGFQALASVLGGIQSMALSCYDEALALPTEEAQATALRTQQIIAHEIGATEVIDPLAGSYYVEIIDRQARSRGTRADRQGAGDGRLGQGDRKRLDAAADRGQRLARAAGHRVGRAAHRRRQRLPVPRRAAALWASSAPTRRPTGLSTRGWRSSRPNGTTPPSRPRWQDCAKPPSPRPIPTPT